MRKQRWLSPRDAGEPLLCAPPMARDAIDQAPVLIVAANERLEARSNILVTIPGFGDATACTLLIDMPELGSMDAKQTGSLSGLAPVTRQSGNWQGTSFIQGGRATLRQALYMPALVAIRFNPPLKAKYPAPRAAGKPASRHRRHHAQAHHDR